MHATEETREVSALYLDYVSWWAATSNTIAVKQVRAHRAPAASPKNLDTLRRMISWCRERAIDPRVWLYLMFAVRAWRFPPQFLDSHLQNEKWKPDYVRRRASLAREERYKQRAVLARATTAPEAFDPRLHLDGEAEARKAKHRLANAAAACMAEMDLLTYGWHPDSASCRVCPIAITCRETLDARIGYPLSLVRTGQKTLAELGQ